MQPETASIFITEELARRRELRPGLFREVLPFQYLTKKMVDAPEQVLPLLVDTAMEICEVSGGISCMKLSRRPAYFAGIISEAILRSLVARQRRAISALAASHLIDDLRFWFSDLSVFTHGCRTPMYHCLNACLSRFI
jgi:hypothetical protein